MTTSSSQPEHMMPGGDMSRQQQYITSTTQAPSTLVVRTDLMNNYNTMTSEQQEHQFPVQDHQRQGYYQLSAMSQQYESPNLNQTVWPSPPSMVADDFDNGSSTNTNYSYHGQVVAVNYNSSPLSPRTWPAATQAPPPTSTAQFDLPLRSHETVYEGLNNQVSMSPDDLRGADLQVHLHYDNGAFQQGFEPRHLRSERFQYESSPATDAAGSPYKSSPASFSGDFSAEPDVIPDLGCQQNHLTPKPPPKENASGEEPYAKLIHKALKDAPDHAMTLQELYKWFKDNTDKPRKAEGTGWQNSIRHNLSMNHAFRRRLQAVLPDVDGNHTGTEKRVSEWYLVPDYINEIKPTTHFREGNRGSSHSVFSRRNTAPGGSGHRRNSPPRSSTVTHYQNPDYPNQSMPGRAISGRRGGRATTSARNARRQRSQTGSLSPVLGGAAAAQQHLQHYPYSPAHLQELQARADSIRRRNHTALEREAEGMRNPAVGPMAPSPLANNVGIGNAGVPVAGAPQGYQLHQFGMADVSGVYHSPPAADDVIYGWGSDAQL
ncbi:forkhead box protein J2 [Colletotrichum spaethianum]|uniref:Forkhead box protein J2 n=1 Tax=Colletotrichum spaethianum TaxID=700344 RepID=A0AA37NV63_9PEZI|nr:forkhead box protein J2 [Colletotrichum spaethianum]GKT42892.1 forkhead box protein J2 [Colletotrichum spaethianum]